MLIGLNPQQQSLYLLKILAYHFTITFAMSTQQDINAIRAQRLANTHDPLELMANTQTPFHSDQSSLITYLQHPQPNNNFVPQPSFNTNYMPQPMQNPKDISDPTTALDMALELMSKAFQLNNTTPTNNNQRSSSNLCYSQIAQSVQNPGIQNIENMNGLSIVLEITNQYGNGNVVTAPVEGNGNGINGNLIRCFNGQEKGHHASTCIVKPKKQDAAYHMQQMQIAQKEEAWIQLTQEEFDFMADASASKEIERVQMNCTLENTLQQASTTGTQSDNAPVYYSDGSTKVPKDENCYDNDIFNMFTQEEQYTELLEPIPEPHQVPQNDSNVISEVSSVKQGGGTVEQHSVNVEETRAYHESLFHNLAAEIEKFNSLSKEKSIASSLLKEKKKLKSDFKIREDELLDKEIQLENKIKELDNILVKMGQSIQTMHMLSPKPDSFYHTEQKMALGYQNPFYLKKAQQKQQSLYNGKVLLEKHDPPAVYDSKETL
ncbi:hypothetical protein Tco_0757788 [Tanacetum coccineum]